MGLPLVGSRHATGYLDGLNRDGSPKDCADPTVSCYTVFGKVLEGIDKVKLIMPRDSKTVTSPGDVIKTIRIDES